MKNLQKIIEAAKKSNAELITAKQDPRFIRAIGKMVHLRLFLSRQNKGYDDDVDINDILWAADIEPRILEVLPAAMCVKNNKIVREIPTDLSEAVDSLLNTKNPKSFRGVEFHKYNWHFTHFVDEPKA